MSSASTQPTVSALIAKTRQLVEDRQRTQESKHVVDEKLKRMFWDQTFGKNYPTGRKPANTEQFRRYPTTGGGGGGGGGNKRQKTEHGGGGGGRRRAGAGAAPPADPADDDLLAQVAAGN